MSISKKIKAISNKIEQSKAHYNLDKETAKISTLSSGNVNKYELLPGKDGSPEKDLLEKAPALERFEYSPLGKELKKQIIVAEKQYQDFDKVFNYDEKEKPWKTEKEELLTIDESSLFFNNKYTFNKFKNVWSYDDESLEWRHNNYLTPFEQIVKEFEKFTPRTRSLCVKMLENYIVNY